MDKGLLDDCCCETCHRSTILKYSENWEIEELKCDNTNKLVAPDEWCEYYL